MYSLALPGDYRLWLGWGGGGETNLIHEQVLFSFEHF